LYQHKKSAIKACIISGFFIAFSCVGYGQDQKVADSLEKIYSQGNYKDKLQILKSLAENETITQKKLRFSEELIVAAKASDSSNKLYTGFLEKGNALRLKSELSAALESYFEASKIASNKAGMGTAIIGVADVYSIMGNHNNAMVYYQKAISILKNYDDSLRLEKDSLHENTISIVIASALFNLGDEYVKAEKWDSALVCTKEAQSFFSKINSRSNEAYCIGMIGEIYHKSGNDQQAELNLKKAIDILQEMDEYPAICEYLVVMSDIYFKKGDQKTATNYAIKSLELSKKYGLKEQIYAANLALSDLYEKRGDHQKALTYYKDYIVYLDSVKNIEAVNKMNDLRTDYEVSESQKEKQKEVDLLEARNKLRVAERNGFIGASILLLGLLATGIYFYRQKVKSNKIIAAQKLELDQLNAAKDKLFSIVSHDLRSSVNALKTSNARLSQSLASNEDDELQKQLSQNSAIANGTYNLLDNLLNWALLQTEQSYFKIEPLRLFFIVEQTAFNYKALMGDKNISFENKIAREISINADQESLKIILRNLFDNAIKFTRPNGAITVYTRPASADQCQMVVEDSGQGMPEATRQELLKETILLSKKVNEDVIGTGLGMQLCKSLIKKNGGTFGIESEMGKGTRMIVILPKTKTNG
jgi:signal transduction histidine kinase